MDALSLFHVDPEILQLLHEMSYEELRVFIELHEDPQDNAQIELFIFVCFFTFLKTRSTDYLDRAVQRAEGWMIVVSDDQPERTRRSGILDILLAMQYQMLVTFLLCARKVYKLIYCDMVGRKWLSNNPLSTTQIELVI